jgi:hypothetical protein
VLANKSSDPVGIIATVGEQHRSGLLPLFHADCTYSRGCQSDAIDATRKRRRRHFAASLQTVPLLSWLRSQLNLISSGLIPTLNRIRPEEAMQREIEGAISMTKTIMVPGNPPAHQTLNTPINSIVAAAITAHELESARRKTTRDKGQIPPTFPK